MRGVQHQDEFVAEVLTRYTQLRRRGHMKKSACEQIGASMGKSWGAIAQIINRYATTTPLAEAIIKNASAKMARRLVEDASPDEVINILSRPNINVLAPASKGDKGADGPVGLALSISADSCGAVMVGVNYGNQSGLQAADERPGLPEGEHRHTPDTFEGDFVVEGCDDESVEGDVEGQEVRGLQRHDEDPPKKSVVKTKAMVLADARKKLSAARTK